MKCEMSLQLAFSFQSRLGTTLASCNKEDDIKPARVDDWIIPASLISRVVQLLVVMR